MDMLKHIKECVKESFGLIVGLGVGIFLYSILGDKDMNYFYGWYMCSIGVLAASSRFIRKREK